MAQEKFKFKSLAARARPRLPLPVGLFRRSITIFLITLVLFIVTTPFVQGLDNNAPLLESVLLTLVLLAGVQAVGARRRTLIVALLLVVPGLVAKWLSVHQIGWVPPHVFLVFGVLFLMLVAGRLLLFILRAPRVDSEVLAAGIATYLVLGILWSLAYLLVARTVPNAFVVPTDGAGKSAMDPFTALYFSFITLSTVGYGDVVPVARIARMLAMVEATSGGLYVAILVARLVTLYSETPPDSK